MLGGIINALKLIIGLRKTARDDKKTGLEIKNLETEIAGSESRIQAATFENITKYDPKIQILERKSFGR